MASIPYSANLLSSGRRWRRSAGLAGDDRRPDHHGRARQSPRGESYLNLAFTKSGLAKLGLSEPVLETFPTAFFEGMASANRAASWGTATIAPEYWTWGGPAKQVDAILMIFAKESPGLDQAVKSEQAAMKGVSLKLDPLYTRLLADQREHFGFHDGISQPVIEGSPSQPHPSPSPPSDSTYGRFQPDQGGRIPSRLPQ